MLPTTTEIASPVKCLLTMHEKKEVCLLENDLAFFGILAYFAISEQKITSKCIELIELNFIFSGKKPWIYV